MKRDTVKTIAGLIIIVGIVVATFMYGNAQRQKQLAEDQKAKQQQEATAQQQAKSVSPSASPKASATPKPNATATKAPTATAAPKGAGVVAGTTTPVTGGTGASLPDTGPETIGMVGLSAIGVMALAVRRSRRAMLEAARTRR